MRNFLLAAIVVAFSQLAHAAVSGTSCNLFEINEDHACPTGCSTITLTTAGTYYQWTTSTVVVSQGACTASASTDNITVTSPVLYTVAANADFRGNMNNVVIDAAVHVGGAAQTNCQFEQKVATGGDVVRGAVVCKLTLAANDVVDFRFTSDTNTDSINIHHANLIVDLH